MAEIIPDAHRFPAYTGAAEPSHRCDAGTRPRHHLKETTPHDSCRGWSGTDFSADHRIAPLLLLGPSVGTSAAVLWGGRCRTPRPSTCHVVGWDLPGHGRSASA